ncbi:MAG TPA: CopD family protein, partial [Limnochordales bacterium]|nr:CopD family protein [Limnochordales bacterium]
TVALLGPARALGKGLLLLLGAGVIVSVSVTGHAASGGGLGLLADAVHVAAVATWGGALVHFALAGWERTASRRARPAAPLSVQARRFSRLGAAAVAALMGTGVLMAMRLIFGLPALTATPYGAALLWKLVIFAGLLAVAAANHFYLVPLLQDRREAPRLARPFRWAVTAEVALLVLVLGATGLLTTRTPPREPQAVAAPVQQAGTIGGVRYALDVVPQGSGSLLFTLRLHDEAGRPVDGPPVPMDLTMPDHIMPPYHAALRRTAAGVYQAELALPMSGRWVIYMTPAALGRGAEPIAVELRAMDSPRESQQVWYFTWYRALRWPAGVLWLLIYVGMVIFAVRSIRIARGRPAYAPLQAAAYLLLAVSLWQVVSTFVAKGYPTADYPNPVPATAGALARGEELFQAHCAVCHGPEGRGDGLLAGEMWPPPSDLTLHAPFHTDGELYWFISKGVAGTDMPAFEHLLSEEERWTVVRYVRSLPPAGPAAIWLQRQWR